MEDRPRDDPLKVDRRKVSPARPIGARPPASHPQCPHPAREPRASPPPPPPPAVAVKQPPYTPILTPTLRARSHRSLAPPSRSARHTRGGENGIVSMRTPTAS